MQPQSLRGHGPGACCGWPCRPAHANTLAPAAHARPLAVSAATVAGAETEPLAASTGPIVRITIAPFDKTPSGEAALASAPPGFVPGLSKVAKDVVSLRFKVHPVAGAAVPLLALGAFAGPDAADIKDLHWAVEKKKKVPAAADAAAAAAAAGGSASAVGGAGTAGGDAAAAAAAKPAKAGKAAGKEKAAAAAPAPAAATAAATAAAAGGAAEAGDCTPAATDAAALETGHGGPGQIVTPWEVSGEEGIDYEKLIRDFGCR